MNMSVFRRSRIVVVSRSNRNCDIGLSVDSVRQSHHTLTLTLTLRTSDPSDSELYPELCEGKAKAKGRGLQSQGQKLAKKIKFPLRPLRRRPRP